MSFLSDSSEPWLSGRRKKTSALARPLVGLAAFFIAGLWIGFSVAPPVPLLLLAGFILLGLALFPRASAYSAALLHVVAFCAGGAHIQLESRAISPREVVLQMARERERIRVMGVVTDDPVEIQTTSGERAWRIQVRLDAMDRAGHWQRARGQLEARWTPGPLAHEIRYGERWLFDGPANRHEARRGQPPVIIMALRGDEARFINSGHGFRLRSLCLNARRACAKRLSTGIADFPDSIGVMKAFMLGYREALPDRANRAFSRTGTLHIAAISGAHVVIFAGLLLIPLKALGLSQTRWIFAMGPLLLFYAMGTGLTASAVRACIMACVFWSAHAFRRRPDGPSALAFSALLILAADPEQLWEAGFLLSFGVVAGLMLFVAPLSEPWLLRLRPKLPGQPSAPLKLRNWIARHAISLISVSLAAWLVSLPMTAYFFNLFSPVGLVANLLVVPLASLILLNGCLTLTLGWLSPLAAEIFNHSSRVLVEFLLELVAWFHRWPGSYQFVPAPGLLFSLAWYVALIALIRGDRTIRRRLGGPAVAVLLAIGVWHCLDDRTVLAATPTGRGMTVLVEGKHNDGVLVDPGPAHGARDIIRWLRTRGVNRLRAVVLTRSTVDTVGALPDLLAEIPVRELWIPGSAIRSASFSTSLDQARAAGLEIRALNRGDCLSGPGATRWDVLHPATNRVYPNAALGCLIFRISQGPASVLLAGSVRQGWQDELLEQPADYAATGILATRWDTESAWGENWLAQTRCAWIARPPTADEGALPPARNIFHERVLAENETSVWRLAPIARDTLVESVGSKAWR